MKVLVTGALGFIGSHVCEMFAKHDHEVIGCDNFDSFYAKQYKLYNQWKIREVASQFKFSNINVDITNKEALGLVIQAACPDVVIHLAALAGVGPSMKNPAAFINVNILGTNNVLDICKNIGIKNILFASSSSVYGNYNTTPYMEIADCNKVQSHYAMTKRVGEIMCDEYSRLYNMNIIALRFFTVYGPRQRPDLAIHKFTKAIMNDEVITMYGDNTSRDYTYIDDIVRGVYDASKYLLLRRAKHFDIFNLGSKNPIHLEDLVSKLEKITKKKAKIKRCSLPLGDVQKTYANIVKASVAFKFSPATPIEIGLSKFVQWYITDGILLEKNDERITKYT